LDTRIFCSIFTSNLIKSWHYCLAKKLIFIDINNT